MRFKRGYLCGCVVDAGNTGMVSEKKTSLLLIPRLSFRSLAFGLGLSLIKVVCYVGLWECKAIIITTKIDCRRKVGILGIEQGNCLFVLREGLMGLKMGLVIYNSYRLMWV